MKEAGNGGGGAAAAGGNALASDSSGCGCVVGSSAPDTALVRGALLGALALLVSRRRRIHRRRSG
jgi:MYXO-CTERM domain-containing protein